MKIDDIPCGRYQHYKSGKLYEVMGSALHSETHEEMVIYKALFHCNKFGHNQIWVRPKKMFSEYVIHDGHNVQRFKQID